PVSTGLLAIGGITLAVFVAYEVGTTLALGMTPGKRWSQIRTVQADDALTPARPGQVAWRTLLWAMPLSLALTTWFISLTYAWIGLALFLVVVGRAFRSDDKRGLHDRFSGTTVVLDEPWREQ